MQDAITLYYVIFICFNLLLLLIFLKHTIYTSKHKLWWGIIIGGTNLSMTSYFISADPWSSLAYSGHNKKTPRFECIQCAAELRIFVLLWIEFVSKLSRRSVSSSTDHKFESSLLVNCHDRWYHRLPTIIKSFTSIFRNTSERSSHNLRSVYHRKKSTQFLITIVGPKIWNNLSRECKQCVALKSFKTSIQGIPSLASPHQKL